MKSFGRPLLISTALVFAAGFLFYFTLFRMSIHLGEDIMAIDALSAVIRASILTAGYIIAFRFVGWLREHPAKQPLAANVAIAVLIVWVGVQIMQYLFVPSQVLVSPLIPDHVVTYVRRPILIEVTGLVVALVLGWLFRRSGNFIRCTICGIAAVGFDLMISSIWSFVSLFVQLI